jgi:hypothetical protein
MPDEFNPRNMIRTALRVLDDGLPPVPPHPTADMAIPVNYWAARQHALVLVLTFSRWEREDDSTPMASVLTFTRDGNTWTPPQHFHATSWSHDPLARPDSLRDLGAPWTRTSAHGSSAPTTHHHSKSKHATPTATPSQGSPTGWLSPMARAGALCR